MQTPSIKRLIINIAIVVVVAGIFFAAYMFFVKEKNISANDSVVFGQDENQVLMIGNEISNTLKELKDLQLSIVASKNIFGMSVFKSLHDFSIRIPKENVERENPFLPPAWKIDSERRMNAGNR
ncbi:MAG: hypothetical protein UW78_C0011G0019 [Candidatus Azambacteria bacterium GW2011_GWA1_44_9]|uniref:Uncharacterized protein n=1 Tax=Candidatus Azambacteria bacterium GW2011_GWA1_44_9 TaxID=1618610 RepID=A0A0G1KCR1_9BACT|nr:MAG: hypothetical protein UW78_C0011G0019 [Candidatus Azambacteria bacterium GW2011_GWA1_44_9]